MCIRDRYLEKGYFEKAEILFLEAKTIRENVLGKEHSDYATSLNNLGNLNTQSGKYEKAEPFFLEAKELRKKVLGKDCLLYTSDAADERSSVDLGGRRIIKKKNKYTLGRGDSTWIKRRQETD